MLRPKIIAKSPTHASDGVGLVRLYRRLSNSDHNVRLDSLVTNAKLMCRFPPSAFRFLEVT